MTYKSFIQCFQSFKARLEIYFLSHLLEVVFVIVAKSHAKKSGSHGKATKLILTNKMISTEQKIRSDQYIKIISGSLTSHFSCLEKK